MAHALVTGGNRGLGFEVSRELAQRGFSVILTARRREEANDAAARLRSQALPVEPLPLDVADSASIDAAGEWLERRGIRLSALVNNAGLMEHGFDASIAERTIEVNFFGPLRVTDRLRSLLEPQASVVMVSSGLGALSLFPPELRARFDRPPPRAELVALMRSFVDDVRRGVHARAGWPSSAYGVSKAGLNALTRVLAEELRDLPAHVNAVCPGWVRTRMGGNSAPRSVEQGASGIVWAATLPPEGPTGGIFRDGQPIGW